MTFATLYQELHDADVPLVTFARLQQSLPKFGRQAADDAISLVTAAIQQNRGGRALSAARALLLMLGPTKTIERLKRVGALRQSTFAFRAPALDRLLMDWVANAGTYGWSTVDLNYLTSLVELNTLAPSMRALYQSIVMRLHHQQANVMQTLLAEVAAAFALPTEVEALNSEAHPPTAEELAEAFSYLLGLFHAQCGVTTQLFGMIDRTPGRNTRARMLLRDALTVCRYREAEVLLEAYPYEARRDGGAVQIGAIDPALERSIRVGYIQHEMQGYVHDRDIERAREEGSRPSLPELVDTYFGVLGDRVCTLQTVPMPRYTMALPTEGQFIEVFRQDGLLVEDVNFCERLGWEDYIDPAAVPSLAITGVVTVMDLLKVQRLFRFLHRGLVRALELHPNETERGDLYRASCLPVFQHQRMLTMIAMAVGQAKAAEVLSLLIVDTAAPGLDIQYAPIIATGDYYIVSLAIMSMSNLPRNVLCRRRQRLIPAAPGRPDPMQSLLAQSLVAAGFLVREEVNLTVGKNKLEVDVLAYLSGHLFVFECKNAYHPCNVYEMRNTYDAMLDAADQLSKRRTWLTDTANQRVLFLNIGWEISVPVAVHTCIALGNRIFNGYASAGHPVRQVHELLNVLQRGYIELSDGDRVRIWRDDLFGVDDLTAYLDGATTHADMIDALIPVDLITPIGVTSLRQESYVLDGQRYMDNVLRRYPRLRRAHQA